MRRGTFLCNIDPGVTFRFLLSSESASTEVRSIQYQDLQFFLQNKAKEIVRRSEMLTTSTQHGFQNTYPCILGRILCPKERWKCNTRFIKGHKSSNHIHARIKSHVYTTEQSSGDGAAASRAPNCLAPPDLCWTPMIRSSLWLDLSRGIVIQWIRSARTPSAWLFF